MFFKGSRYQKVKEHTIKDSQGRTIRYKGIRLIPETPATAGHIVAEGERLDHLAFTFYRDAERFWRICDANKTLWPDDLLRDVGRLISIPDAED